MTTLRLWALLPLAALLAQCAAAAQLRPRVLRSARAVAVPRRKGLGGDYGDTPSSANCTEHWFTQRVRLLASCCLPCRSVHG